jgi:DNA-binding MarR family transcriptional regulator
MWAEKASLEKIRTCLEKPSMTLLVYWALCEIASDERTDDFIIPMDKIVSKCGLTRPTVDKQLKLLETHGLVEIHRSRTNQNMRIPSAYTLTTCESQDKDRQNRRGESDFPPM